ncbi:hypothetical protein CDAR_533471 [Caerostris darwini]|uniref:Uncharacterized protein n=1 Tax=Caerostris darwini TaxID=1538125 RepID=A0AAV4S5W2_9ARAC|nr:hypothetical protein CDAR_533471 [Caerostris darwini]
MVLSFSRLHLHDTARKVRGWLGGMEVVKTISDLLPTFQPPVLLTQRFPPTTRYRGCPERMRSGWCHFSAKFKRVQLTPDAVLAGDREKERQCLPRSHRLTAA